MLKRCTCIIAGLLISFLILVPYGNGLAADNQCPDYPIDENIQRANRIFIGRLIDLVPLDYNTSLGKFSVYRAWKGLNKEHIVFTYKKNTCAIDLKLGHEYLIYVQNDDSLIQGKGTKELKEVQDEEWKLLGNWNYSNQGLNPTLSIPSS